MKTKNTINQPKNSFRASEGFVPNKIIVETHNNIDYYIGINGKVKTKFLVNNFNLIRQVILDLTRVKLNDYKILEEYSDRCAMLNLTSKRY
jgi:hypothetical protein